LRISEKQGIMLSLADFCATKTQSTNMGGFTGYQARHRRWIWMIDKGDPSGTGWKRQMVIGMGFLLMTANARETRQTQRWATRKTVWETGNVPGFAGSQNGAGTGN